MTQGIFTTEEVSAMILAEYNCLNMLQKTEIIEYYGSITLNCTLME
jgi:hypothetical protein